MTTETTKTSFSYDVSARALHTSNKVMVQVESLETDPKGEKVCFHIESFLLDEDTARRLIERVQEALDNPLRGTLMTGRKGLDKGGV